MIPRSSLEWALAACMAVPSLHPRTRMAGCDRLADRSPANKNKDESPMEVRNPLPVARRSLVLALLATTLVACGPVGQPADSRSGDAGVVAASPDAGASPPTGSPGAAADADEGDLAADDAAFEVDSVPVSSQDLGAFPFIVLPNGYEAIDAQTLNVTQVPFWTGDRLEQVEGKAYMATVQETQGNTFSPFEFERHVAHLIEQAGGILVTDSPIPPEVLEHIPRDVRVGLVSGWGDVYNNPVQTYLVRTEDKLVWVHACTDSAGAGLIVVEAGAAGSGSTDPITTARDPGLPESVDEQVAPL
ncbi:hypothetical protein [Marilutibacter aestuarii]|uniref:Uncharacterized protein n=1 Tax=Marilutibacter aestuarii TaxID=1706195 RepID=A0A508ACY9_9GAMM|nr:hypothetical protein [Lysobacter aestuarii]TQD45698.1 hypothetical protein FKV25_07675 [Lysobacter aestuarii]